MIKTLDLNIEDSSQFKNEHNETTINKLERNIIANDTNSHSMNHQNQSKIKSENQNDSGLVYLKKVKLLFLIESY